MSFREAESSLDHGVLKLARSIHGALVPEAVFHGKMPNSNPPLLVYTMPYLPGTPCLEAFSGQAELSLEEESRHIRFAVHLARYSVLFFFNFRYYDEKLY